VHDRRTRSGPAGGGGPPARAAPCPESARPVAQRATVQIVDDRALVAALVDGAPSGFAGVYDAYADRLFAYAVTLLRDRDAAADAVHDALLVARERAGQLRDPDRLRPWLYAITRSECLRVLRDRRRAAPLDEAGDVIDETVDVGAGARAAELRELVWSAAEALNPGEREVLDLSVRHGLDGTELAAALGTSVNAAHALTSRARAQLERALGALLVARSGRSECAELDALLAGWDGRLTPLLRKRLARHVDKCDVCGETRKHRLSPVALLAGVPLVAAPPALRDRVVRDAGDARLVAQTSALADRAGPWRSDGFPKPVAARRRAAGRWSAAAAAVLALLVLGGALLRTDPAPLAGASLPVLSEAVGTAPGTGGPAAVGGPAAGTTTPSPAPTAAVSATTTTPVAAAPPADTPTSVPTPTRTRTVPTTRPPTRPPTTPPPVTTTPPRPPPPPAVLIDDALLQDGCPRVWVAELTATVTGTRASSVLATWTVRGNPQRAVLAAGPGGTWKATVTLPPGIDIPWSAVATTESGGRLLSGTRTLRHDCVR
jgi:RNA polymerase sigma factor (sigma-70 family)